MGGGDVAGEEWGGWGGEGGVGEEGTGVSGGGYKEGCG